MFCYRLNFNRSWLPTFSAVVLLSCKLIDCHDAQCFLLLTKSWDQWVLLSIIFYSRFIFKNFWWIWSLEGHFFDIVSFGFISRLMIQFSGSNLISFALCSNSTSFGLILWKNFYFLLFSIRIISLFLLVTHFWCFSQKFHFHYLQ